MQTTRIIIRRAGTIERLEQVTEALPDPAPDSVQVRVEAAGVAFGDIYTRQGQAFGIRYPAGMGLDVTGIIEQVGADVTTLAPGQRVTSVPIRGGHCTALNLPASKLVMVPDGLDAVTVAAMTFNYLTAYQLLHDAAAAAPGQHILVHAAAGGVGSAILDLARLHGVSAYGTASAKKHSLIRALGAVPIDYRSDDFVARVLLASDAGVDACFDPIGGITLWRSLAALRHGGVLVSFGLLSARESPLNVPITFAGLGAARLRGRRAVFYHVPDDDAKNRAQIAHLLMLLRDGSITPTIAARVPLAEVGRAHTLLESGASAGKVVLVV
ncbi:MAG: zinc-binding dehydrogenase [Chloroflexota bacterium]|nr:zinc-binding dehydrogenase [Chloroflexota bacterium]